MPTKISYLIQKPGSIKPKTTLLSYCLESPVEVLRSVLPCYKIDQYAGISLPVDAEIDAYGLIIAPASAPSGTQIVSSLLDLDFRVAYAELEESRSEEEMLDAFRSASWRSTEYFPPGESWKPSNYLENYELIELFGEEHIPKYQKRVQRLLDIAQVAFGLKDPSVKDLLNFIKRE